MLNTPSMPSEPMKKSEEVVPMRKRPRPRDRAWQRRPKVGSAISGNFPWEIVLKFLTNHPRSLIILQLVDSVLITLYRNERWRGQPLGQHAWLGGTEWAFGRAAVCKVSRHTQRTGQTCQAFFRQHGQFEDWCVCLGGLSRLIIDYDDLLFGGIVLLLDRLVLLLDDGLVFLGAVILDAGLVDGIGVWERCN